MTGLECSNGLFSHLHPVTGEFCVRHASSLRQKYNICNAVSVDSTARVWDMEIGDCVLLLGGHTGPLTNVAAAADGSLLITTSSDGTARVWELEKGECLHVLIGHTAAVYTHLFKHMQWLHTVDRQSFLPWTGACTNSTCPLTMVLTHLIRLQHRSCFAVASGLHVPLQRIGRTKALLASGAIATH